MVLCRYRLCERGSDANQIRRQYGQLDVGVIVTVYGDAVIRPGEIDNGADWLKPRDLLRRQRNG